MRRLVLRTERLTELTPQDLVLVAGGAPPTTPVAACVDLGGLSDKVAACDSLLRPCISYTCTL